MNWFIISVGVAIVMALTAAVIGPHFVDWTQYRSEIEASAERALGTDVSIAGEADLVLLPRPHLTISDVTIGPRERPILKADRVALTVELTPLIKREVRIVDLAVDAPTVTVRISPEGRVALPDLTARRRIASVFDVADVTIDSVSLSKADLVVSDERTGARRTLTGVDLSGSAGSLLGPFSLAGGAEIGGRTQRININAGQLDHGTVPLSVRIAPEDGAVAMTFDGTLSPQPAAPGLAGRFEVTSGGAAPWSIRGDMAVDPAALTLDQATLSYGAGDTPLQLAGKALYEFTKPDPVALTLEARQIDLDRVDRALRQDEAPGAPAQMVGRLAAHLAPIAGGLGALPLPDLPVAAEIDIDTLIAGGAVTRDVSLRLSTGETGLNLERAEGLLPGDTAVETNGRITGDGYAGAVRVSASQPSIFAHWWSGERFAGAVVDPILVTADVDITPDAIDARRISLRIGDSRAEGSWRYRRGATRNTMAISLSAPLVNVDDVREAFAILPTSALPGPRTDIDIDLAVDRVLIGKAEGAALYVNASYSDATLQVDAIEAENLAGVSMFAVGQLGDLTGEPIGSINGTAQIVDGEALAAGVRELFPLSDSARRLASVAPHLAPGALTFRVVGDTAPDAPKLAVNLEGTLGGTSVRLRGAANPLDADWASHPVQLSADVANPDATRLAQQFGLTAPEGGSGAGEVSVSLSGTPREGAAAEIYASAFGTKFGYTGTARMDETASLAGRMEARSQSLAPLAALVGVALPPSARFAVQADVSTQDGLVLSGLTGRVNDVPVEGRLTITRGGADGQMRAESADLAALTALILGPDAWQTDDADTGAGWPNKAFARTDRPDLAVTLDMTTPRLSVGETQLSDARFTLALSRDALAIRDASATLAGGSATGSLALRRDGAQASASGALTVSGADFAELAWTEGGTPIATGRLDLTAEVASSGYTVADLVAGLSGGGSMTLFDGRLEGFNPSPFDWADATGQAPSESAVRGDFLAHLTHRSTPFERLEAGLAIDDGLVQLVGLTAEPPLPLTVDAANFDLGAWSLRATVALRTIVSGTPSVPIGVSFVGPLDAPERQVDVARLTAWAALRSIERQVEAVESDNAALAAEADAQGAPSAQALERLGVPPGAADVAADGDPEPQDTAAQPASASAERVDGPAEDTATADTAPEAEPNSTGEGGDALEALAPGGAITRPFPPLPPRSPLGTSDTTRLEAPGDGARRTQGARSRPADPVGDYIRTIQALDGEVGAYEARQTGRRRVADDLRRGLGLDPSDAEPAEAGTSVPAE